MTNTKHDEEITEQDIKSALVELQAIGETGDYGIDHATDDACNALEYLITENTKLVSENRKLRQGVIEIHKEMDWLPDDDWLYSCIEKLLPDINFN